MQRFTSSSLCPACGSHQDAPRGEGRRCQGYAAGDGPVFYCGRVESPQPGPNDTWQHRLGRCPCGEDHGAEPVRGIDPGPPWEWDGRATAFYDYQLADGTPYAQVVRFGHGPEKTFRQRHRGPGGRWVAGLLKDSPIRPLYKLPELLAAVQRGDEIYLAEGEKDADRLNAYFAEKGIRASATTNMGGAKSWRPYYVEHLRRARLTVWRDRDKDGRAWSEKVVADLAPHAASIRVVESYSGKDAVDHLEAGHGLDRLLDQTPERLPRRRFRRITSKEFDTDQIPEPIVDRLAYRRSVMMLNGASKAGKSYFATQMAICAAAGKPFLDLAVARCKVLLVSLEMSAAVVRERMAGIATDVGLPRPALDEDLFIVAPLAGESMQLDLMEDADLTQLQREIADSGAKLVVLDTLYRFIPGRDLSDNSEMGEVMDRLLRLANDTGAAVLVLHHVRKGDGTGIVSQSGLGAQILGGAANVVVELSRTAGGWKVDTASHYGSSEEPILYRRPERKDGTPGMGCVPCSRVEAAAITTERVTQVFKDHGTPWEQVEDPVRGQVAAALAERRLTPSGALLFPSQNLLIGAIEAARLRSSDGAARDAVAAIRDGFEGRGLFLVPGARKSQIYVLVSGGEGLGRAPASGQEVPF